MEGWVNVVQWAQPLHDSGRRRVVSGGMVVCAVKAIGTVIMEVVCTSGWSVGCQQKCDRKVCCAGGWGIGWSGVLVGVISGK